MVSIWPCLIACAMFSPMGPGWLSAQPLPSEGAGSVVGGKRGSAKAPLVALAGDGGLGKGTGVRRGHGPTVPSRATRERRVGLVVVERTQCGQLRWPGSLAAAPPLHIGAGRPAARFDSLSPAFHSGLA